MAILTRHGNICRRQGSDNRFHIGGRKFQIKFQIFLKKMGQNWLKISAKISENTFRQQCLLYLIKLTQKEKIQDQFEILPMGPIQPIFTDFQ